MGNDYRHLKEIAPFFFEIPKEKGMKVPGLVVGSLELFENEDLIEAFEQVKNVAYLPGILSHSIAMPDIHWGYGFPIGGVAAMDLTTGVVSPGGVGYDINCGVRLATLDLPFDKISKEIQEKLLLSIFDKVPSGPRKKISSFPPLYEKDYDQIATKGVRFSIEHGFGFSEDIEHCESQGFLEPCDSKMVSTAAKARGKEQLGTIGSGNHFIEIGSLSDIFCEKTAHAWGLFKGQTYILIHSGSRGFGHQICQDFLNLLVKTPLTQSLPDKQLACAPIQSKAGQEYLSCMAFAAHFAFNNRQYILHQVRQVMKEVLGVDPRSIKLLYDVCHNIAKIESHTLENKKQNVLVHRKGATRAYGPFHPELSSFFQATGQPVIVPGDMQRASYILKGLGNPLTFQTACHGAGRVLSRSKSIKLFPGQDLIKLMKSRNISLKASSMRTVGEELPEAYKNVDLVVNAITQAKIADVVGKLKPHLVIKG